MTRNYLKIRTLHIRRSISIQPIPIICKRTCYPRLSRRLNDLLHPSYGQGWTVHPSESDTPSTHRSKETTHVSHSYEHSSHAASNALHALNISHTPEPGTRTTSTATCTCPSTPPLSCSALLSLHLLHQLPHQSFRPPHPHLNPHSYRHQH